MPFAVLHPGRCVLAERRKYVHVSGNLKPCWSDTDDRVSLRVKDYARAHRFRVAAKPRLPEAITDDGHRGSARTVFVRHKSAPMREPDSKKGKKTGRDF